jgi:hypothetical protein
MRTMGLPSSISDRRRACLTRQRQIVDKLTQGQVKRGGKLRNGARLNQVDNQTAVHDR